MTASIKKLGLYDLLAPQFLAGFTFPDYVDSYLSLLAVSDLQMASDGSATLYTGTVFFPSDSPHPPPAQHKDPNGSVFDFNDLNFQFRLLIPRSGSTVIQGVTGTLAGFNVALQQMQTLLTDFGTAGQAGADFPGVAFRLELLLSSLTFHLGPDWKPGMIGPDFRVVVDTAATDLDVRFVLPKILMHYVQAEDFTQPPSFGIDSWGNSGFDAPSDLAEGELVTMVPPLALHKSERFAFGIDQIILDLSQDNTPPEILSHFGTDDSFQGLYIKSLQFFYSDKDKDFAFDFIVRDALISFKGQVSLEAELDLLFGDSSFAVQVKMFDGPKAIPFSDGTAAASPKNTFTGGHAMIPATAVIQLQVTGGVPPLSFSAKFTPDGGSAQELWQPAERQARLNPAPAAALSGTLVLTVTDSTLSTPLTFSDTLRLDVTAGSAGPPGGTPADAPTDPRRKPATWIPAPRPAGAPAEYTIDFTASQTGTQEVLTARGGTVTPTATVGGSAVTVGSDRQIGADVQPGAAALQVVVSYPAQATQPNTFNLLFDYEKPTDETVEPSYVGNHPSPFDTAFAANTVPAGTLGDGTTHLGADALNYWVKTSLDLTKPITIQGRASYEDHPDKAPYNQSLSQRRADIAKSIVNSVAGASATDTATGQTAAQTAGRSANPSDRVATITGTGKPGTPAIQLSGALQRAAPDPNAVVPPATPPATPKAPGPPANKKPDTLKRLSFRVRLERNVPVLLEVSGEIDFETEMESKLRNAPGSDPGGTLALKSTPAASKNPADGIVDFTLNVTYDTATHDLTETLTLGAAPADKDGLLQMTNAAPYSKLKDILGAVMVFTPIIEAAATALEPKSAGDWAAMGVELGVPVLIGGLGFIHATKITLFGGELKLRENIPGGGSPANFSNAALTFDYGVSFRVDVDPLDIHSSKEMSVRYKAVGVALNFGDPAKFQFVFDTSKGYSLDLSDPALFNLPAPLGDLLKITDARLAQFNPLTFELDFELKADLGVITVDRFQVKIPLDGSSPPMILPSGVKVNIPGAITGSGRVLINDGGFEGSLDLTIVPVKLRIAADVAVQKITQDNRTVTAVFLSLEVDFPTPIILGATGVGIFGLVGLFAMHYKRLEDPAIPGDPVGPGLRWLIKAKGEPQHLQVGGVDLWGTAIDHWSFGVGAILGTLDGGFLLNLRGMFILELPGPRILITIKLVIIEPLPGLGDGGLDVGIIGILDLDFNLGQITIGVMIDLEIKSLVSIKIPIEVFFNWNQPSDWHLYIGTISVPISADILGIVRGSGYFMIDGGSISPFPPGSSGSLPGVAVALGVAASIIWGSEDIDIYLKVAASADLGVSFSPHLFIIGKVHLEGELRLIIISIGAYGDFLVKAPDPFFLNVHVCGSIDLFFFSISACVDFSIGNDSVFPPPPPLISRMYLQSYAPVIASGQGGERPIDASLGDAIWVSGSGLDTLKPPAHPGAPPVVPIDSVPVLQTQYAADPSGITATFTATVPVPPSLPPGGKSSLGGGRTATYTLKKLEINPPLPAGDVPPAAWRPNKPSTDKTQTRIDLALFTRDPNVASRALQRSTTLDENQTAIWGDTCKPVARPACVLWTLCGQPLGPSIAGWNVVGIASPDAPGTQRDTPVPLGMHVADPGSTGLLSLLGSLGPLLGLDGWLPARIIGFDTGVNEPGAAIRTRCFRGLELPEITQSGQKGVALPTANDPAADPLKKEVAKLIESDRWVRLETGACRLVRLYLAVNGRLAVGARAPATPPVSTTTLHTLDTGLLTAANLATRVSPAVTAAVSTPVAINTPIALNPAALQAAASLTTLFGVVIRERNAAGVMIKETPLSALGPVVVTGTTGLPADWIDPAGPWAKEILPLASFFDGTLQQLTKLFVAFKPLPATVVIEVAEIGTAALPRPTVVIGAVEGCLTSEEERYQTGVLVQNSKISTLQGFLDGGQPVPLLVPDTLYTITAHYDILVTETDGSTTPYPDVTQGYQFRTDKLPPPRLDPWVLCTSPETADRYAFYQDAVQIVFNDQEAIQLFTKYGTKLRMDMHAADGLPEPVADVSNTKSVSGIGSPGYDSLQKLVESGLLPCVGAVQSAQQQSYTAPVTLRPLMAYTLDIVTDPVLSPPLPGKPVVPLFRRRFSTSKYASMAALAQDLGATKVVHRALTQPIALTGTKPATAMADKDIEAAFQAAGEQALGAPDKNRITLYWAPKSPGAPATPQFILIDCTEPLWRLRTEPDFEKPDPDDPSFEIVVPALKPSLEVIEQASAHIAGYVHSPAGTRTLAFFGPGGQQTVTLALHRPHSDIYTAQPEAFATIVALPVGPTAPWENDHV